MATQNVSLSGQQAKLIRQRVPSGRYRNASEVVRAGLRLLEQQKRRFTLRFSGQAAADVEDVLAYTLGRFGRQKHGQYKLLVRLALSNISANPDRPPAKHRPELHPQARTFHLSRRGKRARHFFLYRVLDENIVEIARLLHNSMDLKLHLPREFGADDE